jgi:biopolymer transport protein ExbD
MIAVPMLMRQVVLDVPRKIDDNEFVPPDQQKQIQIKIKNDLSVDYDDGDQQKIIQVTELATTIRPILDAKKSEKVVFVDFEDAVPWEDVINIMSTIRSLATKRLETDQAKMDYDEIKVALKVRELQPGVGP